MADGLGDTIDDMIYALYGACQRGIGYVSKDPGLGVVMDFIDDSGVGPEDRFLMQAFNSARVSPLGFPEKSQGFNGHVRPVFGEDRFANEVSGQFMWQSFHDLSWPCGECGHPTSAHHRDDDGWITCADGEYKNGEGWLCYPCNCGNNIGR